MYDYYMSREENKQYTSGYHKLLVDIPPFNQKSFYGKAKFVKYKNGFVGCLSYDTVVCVYNPNTGEFYRTWDDWSATTSKHIHSFMLYFGMRGFNKKEWLTLPYTHFNWLYQF